MADQVGSAYIPVRPDMRNFHRDIERELGRSGRTGGDTFADRFRQRLQQAARSMPDMQVGADTSEADRELANLRRRLAQLGDRRIGVDMDAGEAMQEMQALQRELERLQRSSADVQVQADTAAALAQLAQVQAEVDRLRGANPQVQADADVARAAAMLAALQQQANRLDGERVTVHASADVAGALGGLMSLRGALAGLSVLAGPQIAAIGAGIVGLAGPLAAGAAGFGGLAAVAVPSIGRISEALKAQEQAEKTAVGTAAQAQQQALAAAGARQQLAAAIRNAAYAHRQALEQVRQAEQQVADAQRSARQAQEELTRARQDARRQLEDLRNQLASTRLSVEEAQLGVEQARASWQQYAAAAQAAQQKVAAAQSALAAAQAAQQKVAADPTATDAAKQQAQANVDAAKQALKSAQDQKRAADLAARQAELNYRQSIQRLKEQQLQLRRLVQDERSASRAGVEGSDQVKAARERLAEASRRITDAERALANARANVARVDAQSAEQVASARRAVASAALAGASANQQLAYSMAQLSPLENAVMTAWKGLTDAFTAWQRALQPAVLPLMIRGIGMLQSALPLLTPIVLAAADAVGGLMDQVAVFAKSPVFTQFVSTITSMVGPAITSFGQIGLNLITAFMGIVNAFAPIGITFLGVIEQMTGAFARFATGLVNDPAFQRFSTSMVNTLSNLGPTIAKVFAEIGPTLREILPTLGQIFSNVRQFAGTVATALLPMLTAVVPVVVQIVEWFTRLFTVLRPSDIQVLVGAFLAYKAALIAVRLVTMAWAAAQAALNFVLTANPIGLVVIAIGLLVAAFVLVYRRSETFRTIVQAAWSGIKTAISAAWAFIRPVFDAIGRVLKVVLPVAFTVLRTYVKVVWTAISVYIRTYWAIIRGVFLAIRAVITNVVVPVFRWLWANVIRPIWNSIRGHISTVWNNGIKPIFDRLRDGVGRLGGYFRTGVDAIRRAWDKLRDAAKRPVAFVINTVWNGGIVRMWNAVAKLVPGVGKLDEIKGFARGGVVGAGRYGVLPGYAPGRDTMLAAVSPGEAWIRPDATRALGADFIYGLNAAAARGGTAGAARFLAESGGPQFGLGGIVGGFLRSAKNLFTGGLVNTAKKAFSPLLDIAQRSIGGTAFGDLALATTRGLVGKILGFFKPLEEKIGGDGKKVVRVAEKYVGISGNPNRFTREWGMDGLPWCGMFVGSVFKEAGAKKALSRVSWPPLVSSYTSLPRVSRANARPGDLALYRGDAGHINIYTGKGAITIGGNESNSVRKQSGYINSASSIRRPAFALGGIVPQMLRQDLADNNRRSTPLATQLLRAVAGAPTLYDDGGWLPPGITAVANYTRRPEAVLTGRQMEALAGAAKVGTAGGTTYVVYPREHTLTEAGLERMTRRQDALARIGRPV